MRRRLLPITIRHVHQRPLPAGEPEEGTEVRPQILAMPLHTALRFDEAQSYQLLIKGWR